MSRLKITALIDNKANGDLSCEHGLSILAEYEGRTYLLDTGASNAFSSNAQKLGVALSSVDTAILSHAHYDHSSGYKTFFKQNTKACVYLRGDPTALCYMKLGPYKRYVGIPAGILEKYPDRFIHVTQDLPLADGVWLIGHSTPKLSERGKRAHLYRKTRTGLLPDDFSHEQSLVFETSCGLVILNSCCHAGADNIVSEVLSALPGHEIAAIIGGFHLMGVRGVGSLGVKPIEVEALGQQLLTLGVKMSYICHCTGNPAAKLLAEVMGERVAYLPGGSILEF